MRAIVLFFLISGMLTACGSSGNADKKEANLEGKLQIVSTIKPIQAIVLAIAGEHAQSDQLIPDYASPHNYSFKPSDIRKVKRANVIFRIDEHMESQLNVVFDDLTDSTTLISLAEVSGMTILEMDNNEHHHGDEYVEKSKHESEHDEDTNHTEGSNKEDNHEEGSDHGNTDFHIWTSTKNAAIIASAIAKTLSELDSNNAAHYQRNLEGFKQSLKQESEEITSALAKHKSDAYIVFHNSWQYFANEFGLQKPIVIDLHEGVSSGAKTVNKIRNTIENTNIKCVFYDASVSEERLTLLAKKVNTSKIDVLANAIEMNQSAYINWLRQLGEQVDTCLSAN
ncbi:MAG: zinc ABC transporter substrate-binding protein [Cocleimonas sp.]